MSDDIDLTVIEAACAAYNSFDGWEPAMRAALLAARPALVAAEREVCARVDQGYALAARLAEAEELASGHQKYIDIIQEARDKTDAAYADLAARLAEAEAARDLAKDRLAGAYIVVDQIRLEINELRAERDALAACLAEAERERDEARADVVCGACGQPWTGEKCGQADNNHDFPVCYTYRKTPAAVADNLAERDALAEAESARDLAKDRLAGAYLVTDQIRLEINAIRAERDSLAAANERIAALEAQIEDAAGSYGKSLAIALARISKLEASERSACGDARDLLRQAHIWDDTRGEPPAIAIEIVACAIAGFEHRISESEKDAARWRALVTTFGPEMDSSTPHRPHTMLIAIDTEGCEVREDGRLDFKETLERALDDEIERQCSRDTATIRALQEYPHDRHRDNRRADAAMGRS